MSIINDVASLSKDRVLIGASIISSTLFPGVLFIWQANPELINSSPTSKIVLLSISIMAPVLALNSLLIGIGLSRKKYNGKYKVESGFLGGCFVTVSQSASTLLALFLPFVRGAFPIVHFGLMTVFGILLVFGLQRCLAPREKEQNLSSIRKETGPGKGGSD